jgi:hypothetical protein
VPWIIRHCRSAVHVPQELRERDFSHLRCTIDDEEDYEFPTWAGVIPLEMKWGPPIDDPQLDGDRQCLPPYVSRYSRRK